MTDGIPNTPLVSVIIPAFNEGNRIADCLRSVISQDYPGDRVEILVVDGGSEDATRKTVAEFQESCANLRLLDNPGRIVSTAMNIGIRHAQGDVIVRVDAHCMVESDYLRKCVHYLRATGADNIGGLMRPTGEGYVGGAIALTMSSPLAVGDAKFRYADQPQDVDTVYLGTFRRDVFERVGYYNESLVRNQDYELNYRIRAAGGRVYLVPSLRSHYISRQTLRGFSRQYSDYGFWKVQMLKQHPRSVRWRHLAAPSLVAGILITLPVSPVSEVSRRILTAILSAYGLLASLFALLTARRHGWRFLPLLPIVFASMHLSWGLGFLWGVVRRPTVLANDAEAPRSTQQSRDDAHWLSP